jgi:thiopeptide-type bacteriocin biosynthesis protein
MTAEVRAQDHAAPRSPNDTGPPAGTAEQPADGATLKAPRRGRRGEAPESLYEPLDWMMLRAPLLPVEAYERSRASEDAALTSRFADDGLAARALAVGSAELSHSLEDGAGVRDPVQQRAKLRRYLIRMSTRPTPYGLFAGVALARWGATTDVAIGPATRPRVRPDMGWLLELVMALEAAPEIRQELGLITNPAARVHNGRVFLGERAPAVPGGGPAAAAVSVRATAAVRQALSLARAAIPYRALAEALLVTPGATPAKVDELIAELCRQTILITDLRPPLTVPSPARYVHDRLLQVPTARVVAKQLGELLDALAAWDRLAPAAGATAYPGLVRQAKAALARPEAAPAQATGPGSAGAQSPPLQVDLALDLQGQQLSRVVAQEVARAADLLLRLTPWPDGPPHLQGYRHAFESKYGPGRAVPIYELLDPGTGLGLPGHGGGMGGGGVDPKKQAERHQTLRALAIGALRDGRLAVELDDALIGRLQLGAPRPEALPASMDLSVFLAAASREALDAGAFQLVIGPNLGATSAGRNLGRFADLLGDEAVTALSSAARLEAARAPGRLWAELVYLPHRLRSANVTVRPRVRDHEIALGTSPGADPDRVIPPDELAIAVRDGRLRVLWPRRGAEVIVCAGHMLNNAGAPAAVRLLEDVARDGNAQLSSFDWGPASGLPFLPRVSSGRIVLALAQWTVDVFTRDAELAAKSSPERFRDALRAWRARWRVPASVYLTVSDNRLLLDLEDPAHAEELRSELRRLEGSGQLLIQEALPGVAEAFVPGPGGQFLVEIVVPLVRRSERPAPPALDSVHPVPAPNAAISSDLDRWRVPGSEWLFVKLYAAPELLDDLIAGPVREIAEFAEVTGMVERSFFLRYTDPDSHLRIRFHHRDSDGLLRRLLPEVCRWATEQMAAGLCQRFVFDSYEREIERYGGPEGVAVAEAIFAVDSRAVSAMLELAIATPGLDRTTMAVVSIDRMLRGLGASDAERLAWYGAQVVAKKDSSAEYRQRGAKLRLAIGDPAHLASLSGGPELARILERRREALAPLADRLAALVARGALCQDVKAIWRSYVHLHCNRLLAATPSQEQLLLGLLFRVHESLARAPLGAGRDPVPSPE